MRFGGYFQDTSKVHAEVLENLIVGRDCGSELKVCMKMQDLLAELLKILLAHQQCRNIITAAVHCCCEFSE